MRCWQAAPLAGAPRVSFFCERGKGPNLSSVLSWTPQVPSVKEDPGSGQGLPQALPDAHNQSSRLAQVPRRFQGLGVNSAAHTSDSASRARSLRGTPESTPEVGRRAGQGKSDPWGREEGLAVTREPKLPAPSLLHAQSCANGNNNSNRSTTKADHVGSSPCVKFKQHLSLVLLKVWTHFTKRLMGGPGMDVCVSFSVC